MPALANSPVNPWPERPPGIGAPPRNKPDATPPAGAPFRVKKPDGALTAGRRAQKQPDLTPAAGAQARAAAARLVGAVLREGRSLTEALEQLAGLEQERDRPLVQELSYGTLRLLSRLQALASQLLNKPLRPEEGALEALILIGLYQLLATRIPPHAAVASTVAATRVLGKDWAAGLVNALLRRFQRERAGLLAMAERDEEARWLFPRWLLERLRQDWPEDWEEIVAASNSQAPQWLRINRLALDRDAYRALLAAAGVLPAPTSIADTSAASPAETTALAQLSGLSLTGMTKLAMPELGVAVPDEGHQVPAPKPVTSSHAATLLAILDAPAHAPAALRLEPPLPMARLPGYATGQVSIQDLNAQLAAPLLDARPGERVLDACAAPGGKTAHLLELAEGRLDLTALDLDPGRLTQVIATLQRLGLRARVLAGDAASPPDGWVSVTLADIPGADSSAADHRATDLAGPGVAFGGRIGNSSVDGTPTSFDRILLDAPCSATGVIRRHPDIKWLRRPTDIEALAARQARLLDALWPLLAPGGTLLYVTCSLLAVENEQQIRAFLSRHRDAAEVPIAADWGRPRSSGRQVLPTPDGGDGFYFARLRKEAS